MKNLLRLIALHVMLLVSSALLAQTYPAKPIKLIVPFPPGGAADIIGRAFGQRLTESMGQPVVLDNRAGADTIIGMAAAARSPADGYTIILVLNSALSMNPALYSKLPYDAIKDFAPISLVANVPLALIVPPLSPAKTASELGAMLRENPTAYSYGAGNIVARLAAEQLLSQSGGKATPIMYKGSAPTTIAVMRGEVQFAFEPVVVVMPHVNGGKMRALGVAMNKRSSAAPNIPTVTESGLLGFDIPVWFGFMAPAGTPPEVIKKLNAEITKAARAPDLQEKLNGAGLEIGASTPEQFTATVTSERDKWIPKIQSWGIRLE